MKARLRKGSPHWVSVQRALLSSHYSPAWETNTHAPTALAHSLNEYISKFVAPGYVQLRAEVSTNPSGSAEISTPGSSLWFEKFLEKITHATIQQGELNPRVEVLHIIRALKNHMI
jgi:hypothetical protein